MLGTSMQASQMHPRQHGWMDPRPVIPLAAVVCAGFFLCGTGQADPIVNLAPELRPPDEIAAPPTPPGHAVAGEDDITVPVDFEESRQINDPGTTTSVSGQFVVHGGDNANRVWASRLAERVRSDYQQLLGSRVRWRNKITLHLHKPTSVSPQGPSIRESISVVGHSTYRFQIDARLDAGLTEDALEEAVVRMILAEQVLRNYRPDEVKEGDLLPQWLWAGVVEAIRYQRHPTSSLFGRSLASGGRVLPVERLLQGDLERMTSVTRSAYRLTSCGLILTMLGDRHGERKFNRMLSDVARYSGDPILFIQNHFHEFAGSERSLDKWWALQIMGMARPGAFDFLNGVESDRYLDHLLVLEWTEPKEDEDGGEQRKSAPLEEYRRIMDRPDRREILSQTEESLHAMMTRSHPVYRAVIGDYLEIIEELKKRRPQGVEERLDAVVAYRASLLSQLDGIDDYLNWWEVRHGSGAEGLVRRYRDAELAVDEQLPRRDADDPIGDYLDGMQALMER